MFRLSAGPAVRRARTLVRRRSIAAVTVLSAVAAVTAFAAGGSAAPGPRSLDWLAVQRDDTQPGHPAPGDNWTVYLVLHENDHGRPGRRIGDGSERCGVVATPYEGPITQCQRVLRTARGDLALSAMMDRFGPGPFHTVSAVVGGTGAYRGASGEARITLDNGLVGFGIHLEG